LQQQNRDHEVETTALKVGHDAETTALKVVHEAETTALKVGLEKTCRGFEAAMKRSSAKSMRLESMNRNLEQQLVLQRIATIEAEQRKVAAVKGEKAAVRAKRRAESTSALQQLKRDHETETAVLKEGQRKKDVKHYVQRYRSGITKAARDRSRQRIRTLEQENHKMQQQHREEIAAMSNDFNVHLESISDTLEAERGFFAEQLKTAKTLRFTKGSGGRCYNDFFRDSARRFLCLGLPPKMVHKCLVQACEMCGMDVNRVGGESSIRAAREELGVMLLGQVGERVDAAIKDGAKVSLHHDATSLLNADGKHLMGTKLRISWPGQPGRASHVETLTMGVKETLSGSAADETNAILEISRDIHEMMVPPQVSQLLN
jgi:hypothetical protein